MILAAPCPAAEGFAVVVNALGALQGIGLALGVAAGLAVIAAGIAMRAIGSMGGGGETVGRGKKAIITGVTTLALVALFGLIVPTLEALLGRQVGC